MKKLLAILLCSIATCANALTQQQKDILLLNSVKSYIGLVATRATGPSNNQSSLHYGNSRSWHIARTNISKIGIVLPNWFFSGNEAGSGGNITYTASVEYPANTLTQITFNSGSPSVVVTSGSQATSDLIAPLISIPKGSIFWIRNFQVAPTQLIFNGAAGVNLINGDALEYSATIISDQTLNAAHTYVNGSGGSPLYPAAIFGPTTSPSIVLIGDSLVQAGATDTADATGDVGELARSVGGSFSYSNLGSSGDTAAACAAATGNVNRVAIARTYATHVLTNYAVNDITAGATSAAVKASLTSCWGLFPTKKVGQATITPRTGGSWGAATAPPQTAVTNFALDGTGVRDVVNAWILTNPSGLWGSFDVSGAVQAGAVGSYPGADIWTFLTQAYTADGTHPTNFGYLAIKNSGAISPTSFNYP